MYVYADPLLEAGRDDAVYMTLDCFSALFEAEALLKPREGEDVAVILPVSEPVMVALPKPSWREGEDVAVMLLVAEPVMLPVSVPVMLPVEALLPVMPLLLSGEGLQLLVLLVDSFVNINTRATLLLLLLML